MRRLIWVYAVFRMHVHTLSFRPATRLLYTEYQAKVNLQSLHTDLLLLTIQVLQGRYW